MPVLRAARLRVRHTLGWILLGLAADTAEWTFPVKSKGTDAADTVRAHDPRRDPLSETTLHRDKAEDRKLVNEAGQTLDSFRHRLIELMGEFDGMETSVHAALGNLVVQIDDAQQWLVGSQLGVEFDQDFDLREVH